MNFSGTEQLRILTTLRACLAGRQGQSPKPALPVGRQSDTWETIRLLHKVRNDAAKRRGIKPKTQFKFSIPQFLLFIMVLALLFSSCRTHRNASKGSNKPPRETSDSKFIKEYSDKLKIEISGKENKQLIKTVADWLGVPHKLGGCDKSGTDCSCFVQNVYKIVYGKDLGRTADLQYKDCRPVDKNNLKEGDLVFFKINSDKISHVGIYLKDGKFVHASTSKGVIISSLDEDYYKKYFFSGGRVSK